MAESLLTRLKKIRDNKRLEPIIDTLLFVTITLVIHFGYRYWERASYFHLFGVPILTTGLFEYFTDVVFNHTRIVVDWLLPIETQDRILYFANSCSVRIVPSCSGVKQMIQFLLLILLYPGPWKHKAWYIPAGLIMIHLTNVFRLSGLCIVMANWPDHWKMAHDYPFRFIFYVVIFFLWVIWNDRFYHAKSKAKAKS